MSTPRHLRSFKVTVLTGNAYEVTVKAGTERAARRKAERVVGQYVNDEDYCDAEVLDVEPMTLAVEARAQRRPEAK